MSQQRTPEHRHPDRIASVERATPVVEERSLSAIEVCERAGISYRQLDYWTRAGYIHSTHPARGSGTRRRFTAEDTAGICAVAAKVREARQILADVQSGKAWLDAAAGAVMDDLAAKLNTDPRSWDVTG